MTLQEIVFAARALLVRARLPDPPALGRRGGRGHDAPGDVPARARARSPGGSAYVQPSRRPADGRYGENPNRLYKHQQFQVILKPPPADIQDLYLASLTAIGIDPVAARRALRGGQLGVADARGVGHRLAGAARRAGDHAVHLLPAGGRHRPRADLGRDHLRPRAHRDVPAGRRTTSTTSRGATGHDSTATCATRRSSSSRATRSSSPTWSSTGGSSRALSPRARACWRSRAAAPTCRPTTGRSRARTPSTCSTRAGAISVSERAGMILQDPQARVRRGRRPTWTPSRPSRPRLPRPARG